MMKLKNVGEIVATRELCLSGSEKKVIVMIGKPQLFSDSINYYCPYQITGLEKGKVSYAGGIDAIQAFLLALKKIGTDLYTSNEAISGTLFWEGGEKGNLGFPVPDSISDLAPDGK